MAKALPVEVRRSLARILAQPPTASETDLKRCVMHYARTHGWRRMHPAPARRADGRVLTAFEGEAGWPDCSLARGPMPAVPEHGIPARPAAALFRELKDEKGQPTDDQVLWLDTMTEAGLDTGLWRPRMWRAHIVPALI